MPELPEVETIVNRLNEVLADKVIKNVTVKHDKSLIGDAKLLIDQPILQVSRRAKILRFHLPNQQNLLAHLKMTGQFIYVDSTGLRFGGGHPTSDWVSQLPTVHTRVIFDLMDKNNQKSNLYFNDQRIFGWIKLLSDLEVGEEFAKYGPDINTDQANFDYFFSKLSRTSRAIKQVIMDNSIIAGVGNIYACDGLNCAQINPSKPAKTLSENEAKNLLDSLKKVINLGIEMGGATVDNYKNADGLAGKYQEYALVYDRENQQCKNCGGTINKIKLGGRGTYYCPNCQI